jgi:cellulase/cellobiase CelA1
VSNAWNGGFQVDVTVANNGTSQSNGWKVGFTLPSGDTVSASWNASLATSGSAVTASSLSYNGSLAPGGSTGWGMTLNGSAQNLGTLTCTSQ